MDGYIDWLCLRAKELETQAEALRADSRQDECDLCKVQENIFRACADAYRGLQRVFSGEELSRRYETLLGKMSGQWREAKEKAALHDDVRRRVVEELKLRTLGEIQANYGGEV